MIGISEQTPKGYGGETVKRETTSGFFMKNKKYTNIIWWTTTLW